MGKSATHTPTITYQKLHNDHSSAEHHGFGDSQPCVVRCLGQGVLVQCRVAHRYPPGGSFPILNCVTYVMHSAGTGV